VYVVGKEGRECVGFVPEFFSSSGNNFLPTSGGDKSLERISQEANCQVRLP